VKDREMTSTTTPAVTTVTRWPQDETAAQSDLRRLGLWMFLATVTMLFAAFTSAYIVRRSGSDWQRVALPQILWWNTAVLGASSVALEVAWWYGSRRLWRASSGAFLLALMLGCGFVAGQVVAWRQLVAAGVYLPSNPFASFFYMMTGAHAVHVMAALAVIGWGAATTVRGRGRRRPHRWDATMGICRTFWHYLGAVWVYLFLLLSVY
jgi:cytochrome c oxidase subunit 3